MDLNRRQFAALAHLGLVGASVALAATASEKSPVPEAVERLLSAAFAQDGGSSGAVAIVREGQLAAFRAFGFASIPFRVPITERSLFNVGSVGKHVTALLVLRLAEAGRVSLDRGIGDYVRGLPPAWARVSLRHLMQHLSGIPDYTDVLTDWDRPQTKKIVVEAMAAHPVEFAPGENWSYSNTNYLLLGWLVEQVGGASYGDQVARALFGPAGLLHARADAAQEPVPDRAEPYELVDGQVRHAVRMENGVSHAADGGLLFSAADWAPWSAALESRRLVSEASWQAMHSPARLNSGRTVPYGFGWQIGQARGETWYSHDGSVPGFDTNVLRVPARGVTIVVMLNLAREGPDWDGLPAAIMQALYPDATYYGDDE
jgi:D-alanyl-D-alanine carboxypeptidase